MLTTALQIESSAPLRKQRRLNSSVPLKLLVLHFIGYGTNNEPQYAFRAPPPATDGVGKPIHDHRDNVSGGGFAFATYHPGTQLPQQPWTV